MEHESLAARVEALEARLTRLEAPPRPAPVADIGLVQQLLADLDPAGGGARLVYAGAGPWPGGTVAWQVGRPWDEVVDEPAEPLARVLSALSSGMRVRILTALLAGPRSTAALAEVLDQPSAGQLFHHLKELLAAGLVHQPDRGTYALRKQHAIPVLAVLSAAADLVTASIEEPAE